MNRSYFLWLLFWLCGPLFSSAQTIADLERQATSTKRPIISLNGQMGGSTEFFSSNRPTNRSPFIGQAFVNTALSVGGFRTGMNLLYSTDNQNFRQSLNRIGVEGGWAWLQLGVGDTYPQFSELSLGGVSLRGAYALLQPRGFRLGFATGTTQQAIEGQQDTGVSADGFLQDGQFRRSLLAATLGLQDKVFKLYLVGLSAKDDTLSIRNFGATKPMSNLSMTGVLALNTKFFMLEGEATGSALNSDLFATKINTEEVLNAAENPIPEVLDPAVRWALDRFVPTLGASASYAIRARSVIRIQPVSLTGQFRYIAPGFQSLGLYTTRNDVQSWQVQPILNLAKGRFSVSGLWGSEVNNLSAQRAATISRDLWMVNLRAQPGTVFSFNGQIQQVATSSEAAIGMATEARRQVVQNLSLSPALNLPGRKNRTHTLQLNAGLQRFTNENQEQPASTFDNRNASLFWNSQFHRDFAVNLQTGYLDNRTAFGESQSLTAQIGTNRAFGKRKFRLDASAGYTQTDQQIPDQPAATFIQWSSRLGVTLRIDAKTQLQASATGTLNQNENNTFRELRSRVQLTRRF
ncbi:MAG: hypothetical protein JNN12_14640 [Bacteroidetes Order II. Incertae sedis bacterium]|nr:hypothetical protein [Bacteroidetes Order II. bacterium]